MMNDHITAKERLNFRRSYKENILLIILIIACVISILLGGKYV